MRVLFIANFNRKHPYQEHATRYRCLNPADDMRSMGHIADVCFMQDFKKEYAEWYDIFIFHRPKYTKELESAILCIQKKHKPCIADYDDLIFDPRNAFDSPFFLIGRKTRKTIISSYENHLKALRLFNILIASTDALKSEIEHSHPDAKVEVIYNGLSQKWIHTTSLHQAHQYPKHKTIAYFPGSHSHDHDFNEIENIMVQYLHKRKNINLHIVGSMNFKKENFPQGQLTLTERVPYELLPDLIASSWITIAPLQDNRFNRCKSGLKFFESAAFGIPVVTAPIPDMKRFDGSGICFANNSDDWVNAFDFFANDVHYAQTAKKIQNYALNHCMSYQQTKKLCEFIIGLCENKPTTRTEHGMRHEEMWDSDINRLSAQEQTLRNKIMKRYRKFCIDPKQFMMDSKNKTLRILNSEPFEKSAID